MYKPTVIAPRSRKDWAKRISYLYEKTVSAIINIGLELLAAKDSLPHGEFGKMIAKDLPFKERVAQRFMQIARHPVLSNASHASLLPASVRALVALSEWSKEDLVQALGSGKITPEITEVEIVMMRHLAASQKRAQTRTGQEPAKPAPPPRPPLHVVGSTMSAKTAKVQAPILAELSEPPREPLAQDSTGLTQLKAAWKGATAEDREKFKAWIEK